MAKEGADAPVEFGADDVFEFAGLGIGFGLLDGKSVLKEALSEPMTADNVAGALRARSREMHIAV